MKNEKLNISILDFGAIGDERGMLTICEGEQDIPFIPKRIFYIYRSGADVVRASTPIKLRILCLLMCLEAAR